VVPIAKVARALKPKIIVVENVTAFLTRRVRDPESEEPVSAAQLLVTRLDHDYAAFAVAVDLADFGVPQSRRRCFLVLVRRDVPSLKRLLSLGVTPFPRPTHGTIARPPVALRAALKRMGLPKLDARFEHLARDARRELHCVPVWRDRRYDMVAAIPADTGRSGWENDECATCGKVEVGTEDATCPNCDRPLLRPVVQQRDGTWRLIRGFRASSYRRMYPDAPASTVTTASGHIGSDLTIHPTENRLLSPLECAELQTIPRCFEWGSSLQRFGHTFVRDMIGEAVPPRFTYLHGKVLRKLLSGRVDRTFLPGSDERCRRAATRLMGLAHGKTPKKT
jgi:DNA (cytosine-5)-methyltransferase 1